MMKARRLLSFLMTVVMLLSNTTVYAADGGSGYDKTAAETVSGNAAGGAESEAEEAVSGNAAGGAVQAETQAGLVSEGTEEFVSAEVMGTQVGEDKEWTVQDQNWYLDYQHSFHYFPEVKDAETGEITQHEEYQLWLEKYAPRDEHKDDTEIVVPEYGAAWKHEVWQDTTMWDGIDDKIIGYRTVLASKSSSGRGTYDSLWKAGESVITSITIEDGVTTQSDCSMMFYSMDELTELNISGLDTSNATKMHSMFASNEKLKKLDLTSKELYPFALPYRQNSWDTSRVTDMSSMFEWCLGLEELTLGESFDTSNVTNMGNMFASLRSIKTLNLTMLDTSKVTNMYGMFQFCSEEITDDSWNVIGKKGLEEIRFGEKWNTGNVESMYYMFNGCKNLKTLDVSAFNTSKVTTMGYMFYGCEELTELDVSGFDTSKVENNGLMSMFDGCKSLESLNVGGFQIPDDAYVNMFRGSESLKEIDLSGWGNVQPKSMMSMFSGCSSLERIIWPTGLDTSAVTDMDYMFEGCKSLKSIDLSQFNTSNVTGMREMFEDCASLESIDVSGFDTSKVNSMNNMFAGCKKLRSLDLRSFDFTTVNEKEYYTLERLVANSGIYALFLPKNAMSGYDFTSYANNCQSSGDDGTPLLRIYYAGSEDEWTALNNKVGYSSYSWATISVVYDYTGDGNMWVTRDGWYEDYNYELVGGAVLLLHSSKGTIASEFIEIPATTTIDGVVYQVKVDFVPSEESYYDGMWKQDKAKLLGIRFADGVQTTENCKYLFYNLENLQVLDIRGLDTSAATTMEGMFNYCSRLREFLPGEKFDTSNVTDMSGMFIHCSRLKTIDVSGFNTSKVTDMEAMFSFCGVAKELDLSGFDTAKVTNMSSMFNSCHALNSLDVSGFDTAKVTRMSGMFSGCEKLTSLSLTGFDTAKVGDMQHMFSDTNALETLDLRSFDFGKVRATEDDQRGDYVKTIIYNAGVRELYLPVDAMNYFDFTDEERKAPNLEKIYYVGTEAQWAALQNTLPEGVTITYNVEGFEKPGETVVPGLEDYRCTVDTENHIVSIHESKGTIKASSIVVPAHATIDGVSYQVVLDKDTDYGYSSLWCSEDRNVIRNIRFEEGVQVGEKSGYLFSYMRLNSLDVSGLDTSHTTDMHGMFANIYDLESLDVSMLDTSNVTNMNAMFEDLQSLKSLKLGSTNGSTVTYIDTSNVTNMFCMFRNCVSLPSIDLSGLNTSKAEDLEFMFENCRSLQNIDVSGFDTRKATAVRGAFTDCASLKTLDLRNWDFTRVNTTLYNNGGKYEGADAYYAIGLITDSGVMDLYVPVTFLQHLDMTLPAEWDGDTPVSGGNIAPNLRRVYYAGTQAEWDAQVVKLPATVELICDYTGGVVELPEYVEAVTLDRSTLTLKMGNTYEPYTLTATISPADARDTSVTWSCDDEDVVYMTNTKVIAEDGKVKSQYMFRPWGIGTATVTVTANGAEPGQTVSASCTVTVQESGGDNPDPNPVVAEYTVTFNTNGGSAVTAQKVTSGEKATKPADPTKEGFTFAGWYADAALATAYDFAAEVTADVTVYAKWTENGGTTPDPDPVVTEYTVTFNTNGGSTVAAQKVRSGEKATKPADPTKEGFTFAGWYVDAALATAYDFTAAVTADVTVYAKWTENTTPAPDPDPMPVEIKKYGIHVTGNARATDSKGAAVTSAQEKDVITITWMPRNGYEFVKWTLTGAAAADATAATTTFTVGTRDVTVSYEEKLIVKDEVIEERPADADTTTKVSKVKFEKTRLTLNLSGAAVANPARATAASGAELPKLYYVTENADIVAVDQSGNFYPVGQGEATVTAYCGNKKATCKVTVVCYTESIAVMDESGADVTGRTIQMQGGEQAFFTVSFRPYDSTDPRTVTWKSDNKSVTVKNGIVTAKEVTAETTAVITATVKATNPSTGKQENKSQTVNVKVSPITVEKASSADKTHTLALKKKALKLTTEKGKDTAELEITVTSKNKELTVADGDFEIESCESTNENVVSVGNVGELRANGKKGTAKVTLTAEGAGTAYIIVKSRSSEDDSTVNIQRCKVTVSSPATSVSIESGSLNIQGSSSQKTLTMRKGESGTVEIVVSPEFSTDYGKVKLTGSGGITVKNGIITAKKVTKKPARLTVKCGKLKEEVLVTVVK